jgi:hypothetical protein
VRAVQVQVVQLEVVQAPRAPGVEFDGDGLADPGHGRLGQGGLRAERVGQGGLHVAHRQAAHEPGDHQGLQRVGLGDAGTEQPGDELLAGAAKLRPGYAHRPAGGLDRGRAETVTRARLCVRDPGTALVAGPAEELVDLGLHRGLDQQPGTQPGHILDDLGQVPAGTEQRVDLDADLVCG